MTSKYTFHKLFLFVISLTFITSCGDSDASIKDGDPNDNSKKNGEFIWWVNTDGVGEWIKKADDGSWEPTDGVLTDYYKNGNLKLTDNYLNGKKNGMLTAYDENGLKFFSMHFTDSKADSVFHIYYESGQVQFESFFKRDGKSTINSFYANGQEESVLHVRYGSGTEGFIGEQNMYFENGTNKLHLQSDTLTITNKLGTPIDTLSFNRLYFSIYIGLDFIIDLMNEYATTNDIPKRNDISQGCLSGDCENGFGKYCYPCGMIYEGEFKNGLYHGEGKIIDYNGEIFCQGQFQNHMLNGNGLIYLDGYQYEGEMRNNQAHGFGKTSFDDGGHFLGNHVNDEFSDSSGVYVLSDGSKHIGNIAKGKFHGEFRIFDANGDSIHAMYKNDMLHGPATYFDVETDEILDQVYKNGELTKSEVKK